jgi:hypothetical protein
MQHLDFLPLQKIVMVIKVYYFHDIVHILESLNTSSNLGMKMLDALEPIFMKLKHKYDQAKNDLEKEEFIKEHREFGLET